MQRYIEIRLKALAEQTEEPVACEEEPQEQVPSEPEPVACELVQSPVPVYKKKEEPVFKTGPLAGLLHNVGRILKDVGLDTRDKIEAVARAGKLIPSAVNKRFKRSDYENGDYTQIHNFGFKAYDHVLVWLNMPITVRREPRPQIRKYGPLAGLTSRVAYVLEAVDLDTREKIRAVVRTGKLVPSKDRRQGQSDYAKGDCTHVHNFGLKAYQEVCAWLDAEPACKHVKRNTLRHACRRCGRKL